MPAILQDCTNSWREMCRKCGWGYKLWTQDEIFRIPLKNEAQYRKMWNLWHKSDIARIEIIDRFGGVYIDCDFKWSGQPVEKFIPMSGNQAVITPEHGHSTPRLKWFPQPDASTIATAVSFSVAFIAAPPGNPFIGKLVKDIGPVIDNNVGKDVPAHDLTGCGFWCASWDHPVTLIPNRWIYPVADTKDYLATNYGEWKKSMTPAEALDYEKNYQKNKIGQ